MFPIILDLTKLHVTLVGNGPAAARRLAALRAGGACHLEIYAEAPGPAFKAMVGDSALPRWPTAEEVASTDILFLAGLREGIAERLAVDARVAGTLVNSEDDLLNCDFHVPAQVRRGDLLLTVSTAGKAPGFARHIRQELEANLGLEWAARLERFASARAEWKKGGARLPELSERADEFIKHELALDGEGSRAKWV